MVQLTDTETTDVDLAVVAYLEDGEWIVQDMGEELELVDDIARELRRYPGETGVLAMIAVDEDFLVLARLSGSELRLLISDATAAEDWPLARSIVDRLGLPVDDDDDSMPAGDLAIVADLGLTAAELGELLDDDELYPEEILSEIADALGFGESFDQLAGLDD